MSLEDLTGLAKFISDLINTNPVGATDGKDAGDDHIRGIKNVLLNTFPNITGAVTASHTELSILEGATLSTAELNILAGATLSTAELNVLDGAVAGTQVASKAVVADPNINTGVSKVTELHVGASGSEVQMTASKVNNAPVTRDASGAAALDVTGDLTGNADTVTGINTSAAPGGHFTSGTFYFAKVGRVVTVNWSNCPHASRSDPISSIFIPSTYLPLNSVFSAYLIDVGFLKGVSVLTAGYFEFQYVDFDGTGKDLTGTSAGSMSYISAT